MKNESLENAKFLGVTLKNIKTFEGHDTMQGFNATVYIDGKKAFHVYEPASGGPMEYRPCDNKTKYNEVFSLTEELEAKLKTRPAYEVKWSKNKTSMMQDNLDIVVDTLVQDWEWQKVIKRSQKKGIILKTDNGFRTITFKAGTITNMLKKYKQQDVAMMLQGVVKREIKNGETILNLEYLKSIGVKA